MPLRPEHGWASCRNPNSAKGSSTIAGRWRGGTPRATGPELPGSAPLTGVGVRRPSSHAPDLDSPIHHNPGYQTILTGAGVPVTRHQAVVARLSSQLWTFRAKFVHLRHRGTQVGQPVLGVFADQPHRPGQCVGP